MIQHLDQVENVGDSYIIPMNQSMSLETMLPPADQLNRFYRYSGSYTTPGCQEVVTWIIYPDPLPIDIKQIEAFRGLILHLVRHHKISNRTPAVKQDHHQNGAKIMSHEYNDGSSDDVGGSGNGLTDSYHFIGFFRHIQEIGNRRIYAPEIMKSNSVPYKVEASIWLIIGWLSFHIFIYIH